MSKNEVRNQNDMLAGMIKQFVRLFNDKGIKVCFVPPHAPSDNTKLYIKSLGEFAEKNEHFYVKSFVEDINNQALVDKFLTQTLATVCQEVLHVGEASPVLRREDPICQNCGKE